MTPQILAAALRFAETRAAHRVLAALIVAFSVVAATSLLAEFDVGSRIPCAAFTALNAQKAQP